MEKTKRSRPKASVLGGFQYVFTIIYFGCVIATGIGAHLILTNKNTTSKNANLISTAFTNDNGWKNFSYSGDHQEKKEKETSFDPSTHFQRANDDNNDNGNNKIDPNTDIFRLRCDGSLELLFDYDISTNAVADQFVKEPQSRQYPICSCYNATTNLTMATTTTTTTTGTNTFAPFLLLAHQHTGSNWFISLLGQHPHVVPVPNEPFGMKTSFLEHPEVGHKMMHSLCYQIFDQHSDCPSSSSSSSSFVTTTSLPQSSLPPISSSTTVGDTRTNFYAGGFTLMQNAAWKDLPLLFRFIAETGNTIRVIVLERTHKVLQQMGSPGMTTSGQTAPIHVTERHFRKYLKTGQRQRWQYESALQELKNHNIPHHYITYEDLTGKNQASALIEVFEFLGLDTSSWTYNTSTTNDDLRRTSIISDSALEREGKSSSWNITMTSKTKANVMPLRDRVLDFEKHLAYTKEHYRRQVCELFENCTKRAVFWRQKMR